jgi:hypothetical protein
MEGLLMRLRRRQSQGLGRRLQLAAAAGLDLGGAIGEAVLKVD